jgi:hypothetical protein
MNTIYKKVLSPIQPQVKLPMRRAIDVRSSKHPAHDEVSRLCGTEYDLKVSFQEDTQTLNHFRHIPGLISILCTLSKDGQVIAFGRSCAVFSSFNRYIERTISTAINGSFLSAANNATKVFEALRTSGAEEQGGYIQEEAEEPVMSEKQRNFLMQLIPKISNPETRNEYLAQINSGMSRYDAGELISSLVPMK